jgi:hypothetical protein
LNNLSEISNRTENTIPSTISLAHQIHKSDPQRLVYPTPAAPNPTDELEQNDCDEGDDVRNEDNDVLEEDKRNDDDEGDDDLYQFQQMDERFEKIIKTRLMKIMIQIMILMNI